MADLTGKAALVTGGSRGIGAHIAHRLAADGANVALTYARGREQAAAVAKGIEAEGRQGLAIAADAADPDAVETAVDRAAQQWGGLDILVNNAGFLDTSGTPLEDIPLETVDRTLNVNVRAAFLTAQAAARHLRDGGRIINIGSCLGHRVPGPGATLYAVSKSAMTGLTKGLARDLAARGITVNEVAPGPIDTDMNPADGPNAEFQRQLTALQRYGSTADIASIVAFLVGEEAGFITGASFAVDGGTTI